MLDYKNLSSEEYQKLTDSRENKKDFYEEMAETVEELHRSENYEKFLDSLRRDRLQG
ncbi:MAG: hypothetical protein LBM93_07010 [Oscillospiraceae bacterium]|jgi:hypothetical protein|nr:hypothetical protein [Oscillospiraceae bacterium]